MHSRQGLGARPGGLGKPGWPAVSAFDSKPELWALRVMHVRGILPISSMLYTPGHILYATMGYSLKGRQVQAPGYLPTILKLRF